MTAGSHNTEGPGVEVSDGTWLTQHLGWQPPPAEAPAEASCSAGAPWSPCWGCTRGRTRSGRAEADFPWQPWKRSGLLLAHRGHGVREPGQLARAPATSLLPPRWSECPFWGPKEGREATSPPWWLCSCPTSDMRVDHWDIPMCLGVGSRPAASGICDGCREPSSQSSRELGGRAPVMSPEPGPGEAARLLLHRKLTSI